MRRHKAVLVVAVLVGMTWARPASGATIGLFSFDNDLFFGPSFTVFNTSADAVAPGDPGGTFTDVTVRLLNDAGGISDVPLGTIDTITGSLQTVFLPVFDFTSAQLFLTYSVAGDVAVAPLTGFDFANTSHLDSFIQFTPGTTVPEPATALLLLTGAAVGGVAARRRR